MKWVDDAKERAAKAAADAAAKATGEAGKSAVRNAIGAVEQRVGAMAENLLSTAEQELQRRQQAADPDAAPEEEDEEEERDEDDVDTVADLPRVAEPSVAEQALAALKARRGPLAEADEDVPPPLPPELEPESEPESEPEGVAAEPTAVAAPIAEPAPEPSAPADLFSAATDALRLAAEARGDTYQPPEPPKPIVAEGPRDPLAEAEAALAKAAEVRRTLGRSPTALAREERAQRELDRLKALGTLASPSAAPESRDDDGDGDDGAQPAPGPKKRRL